MKPKTDIELLDKYVELDAKYPDLLPPEIERAYAIKVDFLAQRGVDGSRTVTPPQDYAAEIVRAEKARGITLSDERTITLMYVLGHRLEGSEDSEVTITRIFKEQERENARNAAKVAKLSNGIAGQAASVSEIPASASEVDEQV
jgi:hypothetical protein